MNFLSNRPVKGNAVSQPTTINNSTAKQNRKPALFMRWILALMLMLTVGANAQVSHLVNPTYGYTFLNTTTTYTTLSGGTVFQSAATLNTDGVSGAIALPFTFTFNGVKENTIFISNNGFITFALAPATTNYTPLSTTTTSGYDGAIAGTGMNCVASTASGAAPEIRYGTNGGGDFVVQFQDIGQSSFAAIRMTYQIQLKADGKTVHIVYGPNNAGVASANQCQVGLRGTNDEDWTNRTLSSGGNWNTAGGAVGTLNTSAMSLTASTTLPASGRTFQWTPNAYVPTYLAAAAGVVQEFTAWTNGNGPNNIPTTNFATNGYGNASWQIDNTTATTTGSGWTGTSGAYTPADYVAAVGGHSARFHSQLSNSPQVGYLDYYVDLSAVVGTPTLDFFHINTSGTDILQVFLSTDGGTTFAQIGSNIGVSATWTAKSISLGGANSATTIIRFKATSDFGSTDIGIDHMLVTPPPVMPVITSFTPNTNLCIGGGQTITITGTGFTGTTAVTFNLVNAASFAVVNSTTITAVTPASLTAGDIQVTNIAGTATSAPYTVAANPTVTVSPTSATICSPGGSPVTLTAGGAVTYAWNPTAGLTPTSGSPVSAAPTSTTTYTVTGTDANGCTGTATSAITVNASPAPVTFTPSAPTVCSGVTQMITSTGGPSVSGTSSTIGAGTSFTSLTGEQTAFCNRRINYVGQTIYTAAELSAAGVVAGSNLTSLAYNISANGDATSNANFTVKIGHVGSTVNFPSTAFFANGSYTTVFGPATFIHAAPGFQTITFSTPFVWDGASNICIDVRHDGIDAINNASTQFTTTAGNASLFGFNTPAVGTTSTSRLNIQLGYDIPATTLVWAPTTSLFTDPGASVAYTGTPSTNVVYFNGTSTQTYTVTSTNAASCTSTGNVTVTVSPLSCSPATFSATRCAGSNFTVTANTTGGGAPYNYVWSDGIGGVYPNAATITANLPAGTYNFTCAVSDACGSSCNSDVTVTVNALPTVVVTPSTGLICNPGGSAVSLTATGASTYTWLPTAGLTPTTGATVSANPTSTTTYTATGTDANGCVSTGTATITLANAITSPTASATPNPVCDGAQLNLTSSASLAGYTMNGNSGVAFIDISGTGTSVGTLTDDSEHNLTIPSFTFNGVAYTTARLGNNGAIVFGSTTGEVTHLNAALPSTANTAGNVFLAPYWDDLDVQLGATAKTETVGNLFIIQYTNSTHDAFTTGGITFQVQLDLTTGEIHFVYQDVIFGSATFDAGVNATIGIQYSSTSALQYSNLTASLVDGQSITFTPEVINYSWNGPNGFTSNVQNPVIPAVSPLSAGTYTVTFSSGAGCSNFATTAAVVVNPNYTITASAGPNGSISPNAVTTLTCNGTGDQTYTITPNSCYSVADVLVDGVSVGAVSTYTFTDVTANHTISASFVLSTYTITVTAGANGSITPATGSVNCGDNATYTITANSCYSIADVIVDGVSQGAVGTYTFTNVTANHTISASFVLNTYTITVTAGSGGSITPGTGSVNCGDNATYTIANDECHSIADVIVDGVSQGPVGTYTFTNVTANHTISASFALNSYTITVTAGANGSITPATGSVNCGDNATYTISPNACYAIADVVVDGVSQGAVGTYTFTNVTTNHTISASFALTTYTITVTAGANGSITPATGSVNCGDNATYTISPNACYAIDDVIVDGVSQGAVGTYTFTNVTANHTISASFVLSTYTITVTAGANGSITPATGSVNCGDNATYTITPDACYSIADVVVDGVSQGAVGTYTFTNVTANHTISASFALTTYTITVTAGANGSITPATGSVNCGDNATYTISPNACYAIADVVVDGVSQGAVGTYTFTNVTANHTISASFALTTYTITVTAGANGSITPSTGSVNCGDNATYTISPNACYSIADVVVDGVSQGAVGTYTFTNVTANHTISASFALTTYTITVTAGANGSITPATGSVNCGDNATYTISSNACYSIADVVVDGVSQGAVGTYTFTNVTANHTISASFTLNTYTITVTAGANGSITPLTGSVNCGDNATYTITPDVCYSIADVIVDGVSQGAVGTYTFTNVTANHTISASFVLNTYTITVTAGANGSITPATGSVNCGDNATYTITADPGYAIADVIVDGVSQGAVGTYTFTNVQANHTISASFVVVGGTFTIVSSAGAGGTISPNGNTVVNAGDNQAYTITANNCFSIADVLVDGVSQGAIGTYTFTNVQANHTISASFTQNGPYTITVTAGANGSITPGTGSVNCGDNASYSITPNACYHVVDVLVDGVSQGAITSYTFTNVQAGHTISATFAINPALLAPVVTGPVNVCQYIGTGDPVTYTFNSAGATSYSYILPPNVTLVGSTVNSITVNFLVGFEAQGNKQIRVTALSACGNSPMTIYYLAAQKPITPQPITASSSNVCAVIGTPGTITYTINAVAGASSYVWTNPAGTTIAHPNGPGMNDTTVTLSFSNGFTSSTITVQAANGCGTSNARSFTITRSNPPTPALISGPTNACPHMAPGGVAATYSITPVAVASSYTWTTPAGTIVTHPNGAGANDYTITVLYPAGFTSGTITVSATNGCGTSGIRSLSISKLNPATPGVIDVIQTAFCGDPGGRVFTYTLASMPANATSVLWTVPAVGATIVSGQNTTSLTVSYHNSSVSGTVTAKGVNNCGMSSARSTNVMLAACPEVRNSFTKGTTTTAQTLQLNVFPNPSVSDFKVQVITAGRETIKVRILDMQGREFRTLTVLPYQTTNMGSDLKAGSYILEVRQGNEVKTMKLLKF